MEFLFVNFLFMEKLKLAESQKASDTIPNIEAST
jgi:hypothetical protein